MSRPPALILRPIWARNDRGKGNAHGHAFTPRNATETGINATPRAAVVAALWVQRETERGRHCCANIPTRRGYLVTPTERRNAAKIKRAALCGRGL